MNNYLNLSDMNKTFICETAEETKNLLEFLDKNESIRWVGGDDLKPSQWNPLNHYKLPVYIKLSATHELIICDKVNNNKPVIKVSEYLSRYSPKKIYFNNIKIKPGMLLYLNNDSVNSSNFLIVFPTKCGLGAVYYNSRQAWDDLSSLVDKITAIRDQAVGPELDSGELLWEDCIELTIEQIAEKFGVKASRIKIKK